MASKNNISQFENDQTDFAEDEEIPSTSLAIDSKNVNSTQQNDFLKLLDNPQNNDTLTSVSLLDITDAALPKVPPRRETDRKKMIEPKNLVQPYDGKTSNSGSYRPLQRQKSDNNSKTNQSNTPRDIQQSKKSKKSFDEILAQNDEEMLKSHHSHSQSDININDLSGHNLKMDTSLDRSKGDGALNTSGQKQRDSTDTQRDQLNQTEIQRVDGSDDKSNKSNPKSHKSSKSSKMRRPQNFFNTSTQSATHMVKGQGPMPSNIEIANLQNQSALLNQSNLALQIEINKQKISNMQRRLLSQSINTGKSDQGFLLHLKHQVVQLKFALKQEVLAKFKIMQVVSILKSNLKVKDAVIMNLLEEKGINQSDALAELKSRATVLQSELKLSNRKSLEQFQKSYQMLEELKQKAKNQEKSFSVQDVEQNEPEFQRSQNRTANESHKTVSPDDGLPDKQVWMFEGSQMDMSQSSQGLPQNSLYYLEHQNSQLWGINKPLAQRYQQYPNQNNFDRSALNITGLNATTNMAGNTMLNLTNMSRNTQMRNQRPDQSVITKRHQGPPSQSRMIELDEINQTTSMQDVSILPKDEELSQMLKDNFNKSINASVMGGGQKLDRSVAIYSATKNLAGVTRKDGKDAELSPAPSSGELRAALQNEISCSMDESSQMIRLPPQDSESQIDYSQFMRKDVSQNHDLTGINLVEHDTSNLNNVSNLHDASGLEILSGSGGQSPREGNAEMASIQMVDRNQTMEVIEEESETNFNDTMITDEASTPSPDVRKKSTAAKDGSQLDESGVSNSSPKSANVNKLLSFFDKSKILDNTVIPAALDKSRTEENKEEETSEAEQRFMQNHNRLNFLEQQNKKKVTINKQLTLPKADSATKKRRSTLVKPSQSQMKNLLEKRKQEKSKQEIKDDSLNSIISRSRTIRLPSSSKKDKDDSVLSKSQINTTQVIDVQRWKTKFDIIVEEKKSWLIEKRKLRNEHKILTDKNLRLEAKVKELTETLDFADNFLQQNDISRINPNMISNNNVTQITNINFDKSMIFTGVAGERGPTPAFQAVRPINQDETIMYKDSDFSRSHNDIKSVIAQNIRQIEEQNMMAEQQLQASFQQASFLLSNNNPYDNSFNLTKEIFPAGQNNISSIGGQANNWMDQKSAMLQQQERRSNDEYEIKETDRSGLNDINDPFAPNTFKNVNQMKPQSNPYSHTGRVSPSMSSQPEVQGDQDEVDLQKSATPAKKKNVKAVEDSESRSTPNIRTQRYRNANTGFQQLPINTLLNQGQRDGYEQMIQAKFLQRDQKLDNMLERRTADFADFQQLQHDNQHQMNIQQQPRSFSTLFSFFKTKMKDSEQVKNLENKLNQNRQGDREDTQQNRSIDKSVEVQRFKNDGNVSLRKRSSNANEQPRGTAGFGPNPWKGSFNQRAEDDQDDTSKSLKSRQPEEGSKRLTFNPEQFQSIQPVRPSDSEPVLEGLKSEVWAEKSKDMSIDFNNIVSEGQKRESNGKQRNSNEQQSSFISNIPRGQDASYIINQGNMSMVSGNLSYADASFFAAGNRSNISGISPYSSISPTLPPQVNKEQTPFFADLKAKNQGQSKIAVPEFPADNNQSESEIHENIGNATQDSRYQEDINPYPNRLTLGQDCIGVNQQEIVDQQSFYEYQELQLQQQYLQEQQLKQQLLQQQLLQQQVMQQYSQYGGGSFAAGPASFMGQTASFAHGGFSGYEGESLMMQQQLAYQQERRRQQYQFAQMDKNQIRNQFLQVVGRGSFNPEQQPQPPVQMQQQVRPPDIVQQSAPHDPHQQQQAFQTGQSGPPRGSAKNFFGSLAQSANQRKNQQQQNKE